MSTSRHHQRSPTTHHPAQPHPGTLPDSHKHLKAGRKGVSSYDISNNGSDYVKRTWFEENEQGLYMFAEILEGKNTVPGTFPLRVLSGSARARILMELGVLAANRLAAGFPTVLILDAGFWRLDTCWMSRYVDFLASPACNFQTIATAHSTKVNFDELTWTGWKIVKFRGKPPKVMLVSGVRSPERS